MQTPKKSTVKKAVKPKLKSDEKILNASRQFVKGFTDSYPKSKDIRKAVESMPEYKVLKSVKKAAGFKKGGVIKTKKK